MKPSLKNLLFWMALVVVGVLIWNFSTNFQAGDRAEIFSEFIALVDQGQIDEVTIMGNEISGTTRDGVQFRTYAPPQYEGLVNTLLERGVRVTAKDRKL